MAINQEVFAPVLRQLEKQSGVTVMTALIMERAFNAPALDALFDATAERQYTKELLFSLMVKLMLTVVTVEELAHNLLRHHVEADRGLIKKQDLRTVKQ